MRCLICEKLSFNIICNNCQKSFLKTSLHKRELQKGFFVYSFYNFDEIKSLINAKYYFFGDRILKILAKLSFKIFSKNFNYNEKITLIAIDDHTRGDYSHNAIFINSMRCEKFDIRYNILKATNIVKYAGKSFDFRKSNKRKFKYSGKKGLKVILIDDVVTTGLTILEAKKSLEQNNCEVLFALTISDAKIC